MPGMMAILASTIRSCFGEDKKPYIRLMDDLSYLNSSIIPEITDVRRQVDTLLARIRFLANKDQTSLLGYIFTLQNILQVIGTHNRDVWKILQTEHNNGASFYAVCRDKSQKFQTVYERLMNGSDIEEQEVGRIKRAIHEFSTFMEEIHAMLYPLPAVDGMKFSAASINPEALSHEVPANEEEVAAAVLAGQSCLGEFAYFDARYGESGRRFAGGDSAWLVTLARLDHQALIRKVQWFGNFLADKESGTNGGWKQLIFLLDSNSFEKPAC